VLACDPHEYHGNTPFREVSGECSRISVVCYYRAGMRECLSLGQEWERLKRLKNR
jgi:hypothetical protein